MGGLPDDTDSYSLQRKKRVSPSEGCGASGSSGHLEVGDKQAMRERRAVTLLRPPVTAFDSFLSLYAWAGDRWGAVHVP